MCTHIFISTICVYVYTSIHYVHAPTFYMYKERNYICISTIYVPHPFYFCTHTYAPNTPPFISAPSAKSHC